MNYRNKIVLHGNKGNLGLYNSNSHNIVEIDECLLVSNKINNIIKKLNKIDNKNIEEILIRVSNDEKKSLIDIKGKVNYKNYLGLSDVLIVNDEVISKNDSIITSIGDVKYYVSSKSFFQINLELTKKLYDEIKKNVIKLKPKNILDLYCGTGSIGIYVCNGLDIDLVGIDNNPSNISDAFRNLELNKMKGNFILGDVSKNINLINDYDLVIVDPPRSGLDKKTINSLISSNVKNIIYVSCDPITLVRDLDLLNYKYSINSIKLFNMFPRTYHCESVCILERR
jgi:23S rRNA (uracil1939-C5)-methyltransferase